MHLGKYALLRRTYLKQHRRVTFTNLLTSGRLNQHLMEIEQAALSRGNLNKQGGETAVKCIGKARRCADDTGIGGRG